MTTPKPKQYGSSPHARGLRPLPDIYNVTSRIIPARAGFTKMSTLRPIPEEDHPRTRGVYFRVDPA